MKKRATLSSLCSQNQSVLILWDIFQSQFSFISSWKPLNPDWASWQPEALIVCFIKQSRSGLCLHVIIFIYFVRCLSFYDADSVFILLVLQFSREVLFLVPLIVCFCTIHWTTLTVWFTTLVQTEISQPLLDRLTFLVSRGWGLVTSAIPWPSTMKWKRFFFAEEISELTLTLPSPSLQQKLFRNNSLRPTLSRYQTVF